MSDERKPTHGVVVIGSLDRLDAKIYCAGHYVTLLPTSALHPLPSALTSEAQAFLEAALRYRKHSGSHIHAFHDTADAYISSLAPPKPVDPVEALIAAGEARARLQAKLVMQLGEGCGEACLELQTATDRWHDAIKAARKART